MSSELSAHIEEIARLLLQKKWRLATAESCTGGMVSAALTDLAGSSLWFERGYVTYSNHAKQEDLQVPQKLLDKFGAVSTQVAQSMAEGLVLKPGIDIGLSITGVAGPTGASPEKPVGFVCFGWAWKNNGNVKSQTAAKHFLAPSMPVTETTRMQVREDARNFSLEQLLALLKTLR